MFAEENKQDQQDPVLEGEAADETYWRGEMTKWLMELRGGQGRRTSWMFFMPLPTSQTQ